MQNYWDQRFSGPDYRYGIQPNAFLVGQSVRLMPASRILLPGDGEGRNSVWLAGQGHRVMAVDSSGVGLGKAQELASRTGVTIATERADLTGWAVPENDFEAVVLTYVHLPSTIRPEVHRRLTKALVPGGWLILEAFHPRQLGYGSGGPRDADLLYILDMLRGDFSGRLDEMLGQETEIVLDEGEGHQGTGFVTRYVGRAP